MPKKKTTKEDIYTYRIRLTKAYSPAKWGAGEWVKNKEALGGFEYTGELQSEFLGYQLAVIAYCNDEEIGVCEFIPNGYGVAKKIFATEKEAFEYLESYKNQYKELNVGDMFTPFVSRHATGEIVE